MISCPGLGESSKLVMGGYCNLQAACGCVCGPMPGCVLEANSCWLACLPTATCSQLLSSTPTCNMWLRSLAATALAAAEVQGGRASMPCHSSGA